MKYTETQPRRVAHKILGESHLREWWSHMWNERTGHGEVLKTIVKEEIPGTRSPEAQQDLVFGLLVQAMSEKERARGVPLVGHSRDRRTLEHMGEVFCEGNVKTLM